MLTIFEQLHQNHLNVRFKSCSKNKKTTICSENCKGSLSIAATLVIGERFEYYEWHNKSDENIQQVITDQHHKDKHVSCSLAL